MFTGDREAVDELQVSWTYLRKLWLTTWEEATDRGQLARVALAEAERRMQEFAEAVARAHHRTTRGELAEAVAILARYQQQHGQAPAAPPQEEEGREETVGDIN